MTASPSPAHFEGVLSLLKSLLTVFRGEVPQGRRLRTSTPHALSILQDTPVSVNWHGNLEAQRALKLLQETKYPLFVTGSAGTGKTTLLRSWSANKRPVVLAPTGIAALQAEGQTIHSFFGFSPELLKPDVVAKLPPPRRQPLNKLHTLVIDEISMTRADLMGAIEARLSQHGPHPGELFGGVRIVMVGDLLQLPPVVSDGLDDYFASNRVGKGYASPWFFEPSRLQQWPNLQVIELQRPYRQTESAFIELLQRIRHGRPTSSDYTTLGSYVREAEKPVLRLTATNVQADSWNEERLSELPGNPRCYRAELEGNPADLKRSKWPAPDPLWLKRGARVVFVRNDSEQKRWVNGDTGTIDDLHKDNVTVRLDRDTQAVHSVTRYTWKILRYEYDPTVNDWVPHTIASYSQLPINLGWARTIHKAQGQSYDKAHVDLGHGAFAPGMSYVALSRVRSSAGLSLARPLNTEDIKVDPRAIAWLNAKNTKPV